MKHVTGCSRWDKHMATDHQQHGTIKSTDVIFMEAQVLAVETRMPKRTIRDAIDFRN